MSGDPCCDVIGCEAAGTTISRLSPEGYLVATGARAYSFREAYRQFRYCEEHHDTLMSGVWKRINSGDDTSGDNVAPTAI